MDLKKCSNGHFYDGDRFRSCPYCSDQGQEDSVTISLVSGGSADVTVSLNPAMDAAEPMTGGGMLDPDPVTQKSAQPGEDLDLNTFVDDISVGDELTDDNVTVSYYSQKITQPVLKEPVVGWLVCLSGKYFGQSFTLKSGRNFIGRDSSMDICLDGEKTVSRERHGGIIYEPVSRTFIAQPGDSRELMYVNDDVVLDNIPLKPFDTISVGKVDLRLVPFCTKEFAWEDLAEDNKDK